MSKTDRKTDNKSESNSRRGTNLKSNRNTNPGSNRNTDYNTEDNFHFFAHPELLVRVAPVDNNTKPYQTGNRKLKTVLSILLPVILFLISTSYHSRYETSHMIETEYFLPELTAALQTSLETSPDLKGRDPSTQAEDSAYGMADLVQAFYRYCDYHPSFTTYNDLNDKGSLLLGLLERSGYYGLESHNYHVQGIIDLQERLRDPEQKQQHVVIRRDIELLMAESAMNFMSHLHAGYRAADSAFFSETFTVALPHMLLEALSAEDVEASILSCQPGFIEYTRLQRATELFVQHTRLEDQWVDLSGANEDSVMLWKGIGEVLARLGYMSADTGAAALEESLRTFQRYRGLEADGKPGRNTMEALSQSSMYIYRMLALNLDRLRKQTSNAGHSLYVNIPSYQLKVIRENSVQKVYRVCVGRTYSPTPLIDGDIEHIVLNPEWTVPARIARKEILPRIMNDADYLSRNRFTVLDSNLQVVNARDIDWEQISAGDFPYWLQQSPGAGNSLGQVKFLFNNPYSVYLHDTPSKELFDEDIRAFSHGCVRVEHPGELAAYLVEQFQGEYDDVSDLIGRGIRHEIELQQTIPVQIRYITCEGDDEGRLYCYKDIYGLDAKEMEAFLAIASL